MRYRVGDIDGSGKGEGVGGDAVGEGAVGRHAQGGDTLHGVWVS